MIKGVNHTIIEVTNSENRYFERALLFVRPALDGMHPRQLQQQADHFIETVGQPPVGRPDRRQLQRNRKIKHVIYNTFWWLMGLGCGALLTLWF